MKSTFLLFLLTCFISIPTIAQDGEWTVNDWVAKIKQHFKRNVERAVNHDNGDQGPFAMDYHLWQPKHVVMLKNECNAVYDFYKEVLAHYDQEVAEGKGDNGQAGKILKDLLPTYYKNRGGVRAFAEAIRNPEAAAAKEASAPPRPK